MAQKQTTTTTTQPEPEATPDLIVETQQVPERAREACLCGCGGTPRSERSRFLPGRDARYHADQKKAAAADAENA